MLLSLLEVRKSRLSCLFFLRISFRRNIQYFFLSSLSIFMCFHMSSHVSTFWEAFTTVRTLIRFFTCMPSYMYFESTRSHKAHWTMSTTKWSFTWMPSHMICQVTLCGESFPALPTVKRLFTRVYSHMRFEVTSLSKGLGTARVGAFKGLFSSL